MIKSLFLLTAASLACAESTVTSMFMYGADPQPLAASIVGNDATATTYSINCPPGTDSSDCGMGPGLTLIAGPKATTYIMNEGEEFHWTVKCSVTDSKTAVCTDSAGGSGANFPGVQTVTTHIDLMPVTVTAGSVTSADSTGTLSTGTQATDGVAGVTPTSSSQGAGAVGVTPTPTPTGGVAMVTGSAGIMFGGVAVALAGAML